MDERFEITLYIHIILEQRPIAMRGRLRWVFDEAINMSTF